MARGPYQDIKFTDFSGGLATRVEDNKITENQSPDLLNVTFDGKGSITPRLGSAVFGATTSATGKIRRTWTTINTNDEEIALRQLDDSSNSWVEYYNPQTKAWENLDAGFTSGYDFSNAYYDYFTYWSSKKDYQRRWNGVCWSTATYADSAYARIDVSTSAVSSLGFLSAGSVVIGGEEVYYSSIDGTGLSGITFTAAHDVAEAIAQLPTSAGEAPALDGGWKADSSGLPHGSIMYEMDSQMFVAGLSASVSGYNYNGNVVWYSTIDEPTNYTISATPGGGGAARYPEAGGGITAVIDFDRILTIFKENTIRQLKFEEYGSDSGSTEIVSRDNIISSPKIGAINSKSTTKVENDILYVTPGGWVKSLASTGDGNKTNELSLAIRPTLEDYNMTSATATYFDGKYYLACATSDAANNNTVFVWDYDYGAWTKFNNWNVSDWYILNNVLYFGTSNELATHRALVNYDDITLPYETYWSSKWLDYEMPNEQKRLGMIYIEGYITSNASLGVSAYFDGDGANPAAKSIVGSNTNYISLTETLGVIGKSTWGKGTYGTGTEALTGSAYTLRKFRWWGRYSGKNFYNMQIKVGTASPGYVYKVTHIAPYLVAIPGKRIPIKSII